MPACSKTKTRPRGGVAAGQRRARGPRTHTTGHSGRRRSARDAVPFVLPRTRPGEREGSSPPRLGGTRHAARVTFPRAEIMFKRLFGAEKSGGGSAPSAGSTGGGGGGKTTPLGAVEQLKDVRHPRSNPRGCLFFSRGPRRGRVPCAVAQRKARGRPRNVAFFCEADAFFIALPARGVSFADSRSRVFQPRDTDPAHSTRHSFRPLPRRRRLADHLHAGEARGVVAQEDGGGAE